MDTFVFTDQFLEMNVRLDDRRLFYGIGERRGQSRCYLDYENDFLYKYSTFVLYKFFHKTFIRPPLAIRTSVMVSGTGTHFPPRILIFTAISRFGSQLD